MKQSLQPMADRSRTLISLDLGFLRTLEKVGLALEGLFECRREIGWEAICSVVVGRKIR